MPIVYHIAGPQGSGKSTLARSLLAGGSWSGPAVHVQAEELEFLHRGDVERVRSDHAHASVLVIEYHDRQQVRPQPGEYVLHMERARS